MNRTLVQNITSIDYFNRAIMADPDYAQGYAGLCLAYVVMSFGHGPFTPTQALADSRKAALHALSIDATTGDAHSCLAWVKAFGDWDWSGANDSFRRAIELGPNSVAAHRLYSRYLSAMQRHKESIVEAELASTLDPASPIARYSTTSSYWYAGEYEKSAALAEDMERMDPSYPGGSYLRGLAYFATRHYEQSITHFRRAITLSGKPVPLWHVAVLGCAYARSGRRDDAVRILNQLRSAARDGYVSPYSLALLYDSLDNHDKAVELLEKAFAERNSMMATLQVEPIFDEDLRADPRFQNILLRMRFLPPAPASISDSIVRQVAR